VKDLAGLIPVRLTDELLALVAEGFCPLHKTPLDSGARSWLPWCAECEASWTPITLSDLEGIEVSRLVQGQLGTLCIFRARRV
jgi:hypothetical protein